MIFWLSNVTDNKQNEAKKKTYINLLFYIKIKIIDKPTNYVTPSPTFKRISFELNIWKIKIVDNVFFSLIYYFSHNNWKNHWIIGVNYCIYKIKTIKNDKTCNKIMKITNKTHERNEIEKLYWVQNHVAVNHTIYLSACECKAHIFPENCFFSNIMVRPAAAIWWDGLRRWPPLFYISRERKDLLLVFHS